VFIDASAMVAIIANEAEGNSLRLKLKATKHRHISGMVIYEAVLALIRIKDVRKSEALEIFDEFVKRYAIKTMDIDRRLSEMALEVFERFGKGNHPARLNIGDCYSYACAKALKQPLLYKGDDFSQTDISKA
jgi:ribonuclease VapC